MTLSTREHINRAHKALGIVSKIQDFVDEANLTTPDGIEPLTYREFLTAIKHPYLTESVKILTPFCEHCRSWPSRETWKYVEEFLTNYEITKVIHND